MGYIVSDDDEELLVLIALKQPIDLKAIKIRASVSKMDGKLVSELQVSAPKLLFIYAVNDLNVNFDDLETMQEDKDITTGLKKVNGKGQMVKLQNEPKNMAKFKKLKYLAVCIKSNHKETDRTLLHSITLIQNFDKPKADETKQNSASPKQKKQKQSPKEFSFGSLK